MNNVQTNIMSAVPAPSTTMKANAAESVRPAGRAGATADRGAKNPSFDRALAKLKTLKQNLAEATEALGKDSLAASLAASQQMKRTEAGDSMAKAAEIAAPVESGSLARAVADTGMPLEAPALMTLPASEEEQQEPSFEMASADDVQDTAKLPLQEEMPATESKSMPAHNESDSAAKAQMLNRTADMSCLASLLPHREQSEQGLLQALSGRILPPMLQAETTATSEQVDRAMEMLQLTVDDGFSGAVKAAQQADMNSTVHTEDDAVLPDSLLRALAQQPAVSAVAGTTQEARQAAASLPLGEEGNSIPTAPLDAGIVSSTSADMAEGQDSSQEKFAEIFGEQQTPQDKKAEGSNAVVPSATTQVLEGAARPKSNDAMQLFTEAGQTPQSGQEASHASQMNPGVSFQTTLQEAAEAQPTALAAPQKDYEVAKQIVEQARLLRMPEQTEMVIRLKPEHLGELTLKVSVAASGAVNAAFHTDNASVRAIIETSMIQLKHELQAQGLKVDNVGVYAGLGEHSMMNGQQDADAHYAQHGGQGSSQGRDAQQALASFEEEQQALAAGAQQGVLAQDGVDYRI